MYYTKRKVRKDRLALLILIGIAILTTLIGLWFYYQPKEVGITNAIQDEKEIEQVESTSLFDIYHEYGTTKLSFYCSCEKCNGNNAGVNAHDQPLAYGMCASNYYPQGFEFYLYINGVMQPFVVCDKMATRYNDVNIIDIYVPLTHEECEELGIKENVVIYTK